MWERCQVLDPQSLPQVSSLSPPFPPPSFTSHTIALSQEETDPSILASPGELQEPDRGVKTQIKGMHVMTGSFSQLPCSLTCTTSLAPAASTKLMPLKSRTTTLMGSAPKMEKAGASRHLCGSRPNLPLFTPSHLCQVDYPALETALNREKQSHQLQVTGTNLQSQRHTRFPSLEGPHSPLTKVLTLLLSPSPRCHSKMWRNCPRVAK